MKFDDNIYNALNSYKPKTIKTFEQNIARVIKLFHTNVPHVLTKEDCVFYLLNNENTKETIIANIQNKNSLAVCTYACYVILNKLMLDYSIYFELYKTYSAESMDERTYADASNKEKNNFLTMDDVRQRQFELEKKVMNCEEASYSSYTFLNLYQQYLLCSLYAFYPALRGQDYYETQLIQSDENVITESNTYNLTTGTLVIKHHKTERKIGDKILQLPDILQSIILKWSQINPTNFLIINTKTKTKITQQAFTNLLNRIFEPKKVSSSMLRKIYVSDFLMHNPSTEERKRIAKIMGHGIASQEFVYSRFKDLYVNNEEL